MSDNSTLPYPRPDGEHPTLVIPGEADAGAVEPRTKRRRWPWVLLVVVVVLAGLVVAAEFVARSILPGIVRGIVIEQLDLPADQAMDVQADGILLPQLIGGNLDSLHLASDAVTLQGITGAVDITATGVPLRGGELGGASGSIRIDQAEFTKLLAGIDLPIEKVTLDGPDATLVGAFEVFGMPVPISLTMTPSAVEGDLELTPKSIALGGFEVTAEQVESTLGGAASGVTGAQRLCIADQLPAGLTLAGLRIEGSVAIFDIQVDGAITTDESLLEKGVCPR